MPLTNDLSIRHRDRADRNFALRLGAAGLGNGRGHKLKMFAGHAISRLTLAKPRTKIRRWGPGT
jgi:hypothetical protein